MQFVKFFGVSSVVAVVFMFFAVVVVFLALFSSSRHCAVFQYLFALFVGVFFVCLKKKKKEIGRGMSRFSVLVVLFSFLFFLNKGSFVQL